MIKKLLFSFLTIATFISCSSDSKTIVVRNTMNFDRNEEIVEIKAGKLDVDIQHKPYVLKDQNGNEIDYQLISKDGKVESIIFQADVPADSSVTYILSEGTPSEVKAKTYARYIPERKDDFAWENEYAAYRMYGPAIANENPSNGVDLFLKRTDELVVDKFYDDHLNNGLSYHIDHGQGLDCYAVGHTLGAGGIAPYTSELWVGKNYDHYEVLENGPLRSRFILTYDSVKVGDQSYKQTITITTDAGSVLNKAEVRYEGDNIPMKLAGGIFLHDGKGTKYQSEELNVIGYAEDAVSDAGNMGRNYVGIYMPGVDTSIQEDGKHLLILSDYLVNSDFTYYFGGGWNKWGFPDDTDWFDALNRFSQSVQNPLEVTIK